mmetsp:Transcript_41574/g.36943  ORF Transcript_41574/g.36943 Transcript_41574/m.36943 type:complete len:83 (+) Transcript_41574:427-675(+)
MDMADAILSARNTTTVTSNGEEFALITSGNTTERGTTRGTAMFNLNSSEGNGTPISNKKNLKETRMDWTHEDQLKWKNKRSK